jgi:glutathione reductase (NADPH)
MTNTEQFDLIVIGGGTGANGLARACRAAGLTVASIEVLPYGGTCALRGCDPKKMLVGVTDALDWSGRMVGKGLGSLPTVDWAQMIAFKRTFTDATPGKVEGGLSEAGVVTIHGTAEFTSREELRVGDRRLRAKHFHIATGARPRTLGITGEELLITSTQFLELEQLPQRIAFVGGGFISFEFAHIAKRAGAAEVTILHQGERALNAFDPDLVELQVARTRELGIDVRLQACVCCVAQHDGALRVDITTTEGPASVACDAVVHGAGRVPDVEALGLELANVEYGPRGIKVSEYMRSVSNPNVFAAGDCADTRVPNLTPVSAYQGRIASKNLLAGKDARRVEYPPIPSVVFTLPPVGRVGLLEAEARAQGLDFDVHFSKTSNWYSSIRVAEPYTAYKTLVDKGTGRILGAHIMGPGAEEQLNLLTLAMKAGITANQLKATIFAYPSYASDVGYML